MRPLSRPASAAATELITAGTANTRMHAEQPVGSQKSTMACHPHRPRKNMHGSNLAFSCPPTLLAYKSTLWLINHAAIHLQEVLGKASQEHQPQQVSPSTWIPFSLPISCQKCVHRMRAAAIQT